MELVEIDVFSIQPFETSFKGSTLHQAGVSFREIERSTGVSHNTVINWVKSTQPEQQG